MKIHPAAMALPEMNTVDFAALKSDIEKHGQLCPVEIVGGQLIDGRHRWKACDELGLACDTVDVDLNGQTAGQYVWSLNGARRHITASQRATVAVELLPEIAKDNKPGRPGKERINALIKTSEFAAKMVNVSETYVKHAKE